jgi:hypothetical protein
MSEKRNDLDKMVYKKQKKCFEDSGVVIPNESYYVQLENVSNRRKQDIKTMIDSGRYFSIFAPRQSGKTTFLKEMCHHLHREKTYIAIKLSFQDLSSLPIKEFYAQLETDLYSQLKNRLQEVKCEKTNSVIQLLKSHHLSNHISFRMLFEKLNQVIEHKKIVVFIDEFDGIPQKELENFLTTLRELYQKYKDTTQKALYSVGLVGIRNVTKLIVGGVSPFNIADQVDLPPFSLKNVQDLYFQYTEETNQPFTVEAVERVYKATSGQPWLVNRLGTILTINVKSETTASINEEDVEKAIKILLNEKNAHFDNLYEKAKQFKETFVEIAFDHTEYNPDDEDQSWLEQYGLIKNSKDLAVVSNSIYQSRYLKTFFKEIKAYDDISPLEYELPGDKLDMQSILMNFEEYIAQIGAQVFSEKDKPYEKTGQYLLTAWLYQLIRGGRGELRYEVRSGHGRMDILLIYKGKKYIIETKVNRRKDISAVINQGIRQLSTKYLASEKADEGYLVIFDPFAAIGTSLEPQKEKTGDKDIYIFNIGIAKTL